jgi:uncharacterized damage-inducible protein DinB
VHAMDLLANWSAERDRLRRGLSLLSDEHLAFRLRPSGMSIGEIVCHLATGEWFWFAAAAGEDISPPQQTLTADAPTVPAHIALLDRVHAQTKALLDGCTDDDLDRQVTMPWGASYALGQIAWMILSEELHHRGQLFQMIAMQGLMPPDQ